MANNALQYPSLSVKYNGVSTPLVQSVTIDGDSGLETLSTPSGSVIAHGPTSVNVSVNSLSPSIGGPTGTYSGLREPVDISINSLQVSNCFVNSIQYSLESDGFFTSSFSYQGDSVSQSTPLMDLTSGPSEGDDNGDGVPDPSFPATGKAPYRVFFGGGSFDEENLKSISINYAYDRELIYAQGEAKPFSVLKYPVESTISFQIYVSYKTDNQPNATILDNLYTGVYLQQLACDDATPTENLNISILGPAGDSVSFAGVRIKDMSVEGGSVNGEPLEYNMTFVHYSYEGISPRVYQYQ